MRRYLLLIVPTLIFSKVHYAKVEPYERYTIESAVAGEVVISKRELEGSFIQSSLIVKLDSRVDEYELKSSRERLKIIGKILEINRESLSSVKESLDREESYYLKIESLSTIPQSKRDNAFYSYISTKSKYLSIKEKIESLKEERLGLELKIATLKDRLSKKRFTIKGRFLNELLVHKRDFVTAGTPIAVVDDLTKAKLVIYLNEDELENIENRRVYIDGSKTDLKISKVWKVADKKFISSYRVEILVPNPKYRFSTLLKVELR